MCYSYWFSYSYLYNACIVVGWLTWSSCWFMLLDQIRREIQLNYCFSLSLSLSLWLKLDLNFGCLYFFGCLVIGNCFQHQLLARPRLVAHVDTISEAQSYCNAHALNVMRLLNFHFCFVLFLLHLACSRKRKLNKLISSLNTYAVVIDIDWIL